MVYEFVFGGLFFQLLEFPNFKIKHGGPNIQFYLLDIDRCGKNNGDPCDDDVLSSGRCD